MKDLKSVLLILVFAFCAGIVGGGVAFNHLAANFVKDDTEQTIVLKDAEDLSEVIESVMPAVVSIEVFVDDNALQKEFQVSGGTGFFVTEDGLILTNKHVLIEDAQYKVLLNSGERYDAEVVSEDPFEDVAVLRISETQSENEIGDLNFPIVKFGNSDSLKIGQQVFAIGNALAQYGNSVTAGIISAKGREISAFDDTAGVIENLSGLLQTDAAINFGNSGGPLINVKGEVVGMNVALAEAANAIGFAIPIDDLKPVLESVEQHGEIIRPILGVRFVMLSEEQAEDLTGAFDEKVSNGALVVSGGLNSPGIVAGGPAEEAGIQDLDLIFELNGEEIELDNPLHKIIRQYSPGDQLELKIWRAGEILTKTVTLISNKDLE